MENILKILKQLVGTGTMVGSIPKPIKIALLYFTVFVMTVGIFRYAKLSDSDKTFLIVALVILGVITGGYFIWKAWKDKQQNQQFGGEISQHSSATPRPLSDPGQRARLDEMRKKFQSGVDAYKSRGKDLYKLPWYVIVGEPGSGKTEAVRHSNVGFPPGMQDEFQGVGGTINMNWWFTNHAVLLDTAGRLMFEEVKPGETSEWKEFLTLLKKNRPNCPINGLFLVIPSDSLIKDSADAIQKKAGKIAQQLDVIQRVLDVRFPVFVVVTKCDKINGFREFFDGLTDPQLQHQMMGWSNPQPLDEPFQPERVDQHLTQVAARLRRRRLGLMRDPIPEDPEGRRTDEVDTFYAFPHSLELLSSRLRRYLETIFIAGEWSAKPLFLRGIYFSSAMREGAALDAELAELLGVGVEELPEGKIWERERAYFLRDLFLEKVFREKGLITSASNTKTMLRNQQILLFAAGFGSLALFAGLAWFAKGNLHSGVKDQGDYWNAVSTEGWDGKYWKHSIVPTRGDGSFGSLSSDPVKVDGRPVALGDFHARLRDLTDKPLPRNLMFPGLANTYNQNSRKAQRIVFEAGVVRPLIDATRQKMQHDEGDPANGQRHANALAALIQLESDILSRGHGTNNGEVNLDSARKFLGALESYVAGQDVTPDTNLVAVMSWTYSTNDTAKGAWPPRWFSGGRDGLNNLTVNSAINSGLDIFVRSATNGVQTYLGQWNQISAVGTAARDFAKKEQDVFAAAANCDAPKIVESVRALQTIRATLTNEIQKAATLPAFAGSLLLTSAQQKFSSDLTSSAAGALTRVRVINDAALAANSDYPLFKEIKSRLEAVQSSMASRMSQLLDNSQTKDFAELDRTCLADKAFAKRADLYARAAELMTDKPFNGKLVGLKADPLDKYFKERLVPLREALDAYSGELKKDCDAVLKCQLKEGTNALTKAFLDAWLAEAKSQLAACNGFPLVADFSRMMAPDKFIAAGKKLKDIAEDLASPNFLKYGLRDRSDECKQLSESVTGQQNIASALLDDEGRLRGCTISLLASSTDTTSSKDEWRGTWRDMKLVCDGKEANTIRTDSDHDQSLGVAPVQQKFNLQLIKNVNANDLTTFQIASSDWGPLWLLHKYSAAQDHSNPKIWRVEVPAEAPGARGAIRLKLEFEKALPDLEKWPKR
jgi:hypothetical protein